jgi:UPF0176 protein
MNILNIAGYQFIPLSDLSSLRNELEKKCRALLLKGTILLGAEGINLSLAGAPEHIHAFKADFLQDVRFCHMTFRESESAIQPFKRMKVKIKKEIITMGEPTVRPEMVRAPSISPKELKTWLDEARDITILDTRNDYEVQFGTFEGAVNLHLNDFGEFPKASETVNRDKPVVMFCTGGIRCEKAALHLLNTGFQHVYQLEGGILNYFKEVGGEHYQGDCFVFDERIAVNAELKEAYVMQCSHCNGPVKQHTTHACVIS